MLRSFEVYLHQLPWRLLELAGLLLQRRRSHLKGAKWQVGRRWMEVVVHRVETQQPTALESLERRGAPTGALDP